MRIGIIDLGAVQLPEPAGEHQRAGATAALVRELGDNYGKYHAYLAAELAKIGRPPQIDDYSSAEECIAAWARAQQLVAAEALLRNCRAFRRSNRRLDTPLDTTTPLLDSSYRLVSVE